MHAPHRMPRAAGILPAEAHRRTLQRERDTLQPSSTGFSAALPICHSPQLGRSTAQPGSLDFCGGAIRTARLSVIRGESAADVTACPRSPAEGKDANVRGACRGVKRRLSVLLQAAKRDVAVPAGAIGSDGSSADDAGYPAPDAERRGGGRPQRMRPAKVPRLAGQGRPVYRAKAVKAAGHPGKAKAPWFAPSGCVLGAAWLQD